MYVRLQQKDLESIAEFIGKIWETIQTVEGDKFV